MAQRTDLYSILMNYADRHHSPYIDIETFIVFLEKYAGNHTDEQPEWKKWVDDVNVKFWGELNHLIEEGKCVLLDEKREGQIYLAEFYADIVRQTYESLDANAGLPFPCEQSLGISIPRDQVRVIGIETDMSDYLNAPQEAPFPILMIAFPENITPALVLSSLLPQRFIEAALLKIRYYLQNHNNKEYILHKLMPQFMGKETLLREMFKQVEIHPLDCLHYLETGGEFSVLFWLYFCNMIKTEIRRKDDLLAEDIAAFQSVYIINVMTVYYKKKVMLAKEKELAFSMLEQRLNKAPFLYSMNDIINFTGANGQSLLGQYSAEELEEYLTRQTTECMNQELPALLIFYRQKDEQLFIFKDRVIPLCTKLLVDIRPQVQKAISLRWQGMLREFNREDAMEQDYDFEKLLESCVNEFSPFISLLTGDKRLYLINAESERFRGLSSESSMLFNSNGTLLPFSTLLLLKRKALLVDARLLLPFWYSIPIVTTIIAFFKHIGSGKGRTQSSRDKASPAEEGSDQAELMNRVQRRALQSAARDYKSAIVPIGYTLESYLEELEDRWRKLLDKKDKKTLVEDVKSLIRDKLRRALRQWKRKRITQKTFASIADGIMAESSVLEQLDTRESVHLYIQLYIIKLIENIKT
ncbi:MAG: hypothetical protein LBD78_02845 [Spirochaetaceae bacterium]|jgi:hypothetical protein|nr:hypothetical protein [Spirochaetaceae bacterium]